MIVEFRRLRIKVPGTVGIEASELLGTPTMLLTLRCGISAKYGSSTFCTSESDGLRSRLGSDSAFLLGRLSELFFLTPCLSKVEAPERFTEPLVCGSPGVEDTLSDRFLKDMVVSVLNTDARLAVGGAVLLLYSVNILRGVKDKGTSRGVLPAAERLIDPVLV